MSDRGASADTLAAMLAKADEKLLAAQRDLKDGLPGEAASRAYYAVFHAASAVLAAKGMAYTSHSQVIGAFNREMVKTGAFPPATSRTIQRLFEDRQTADYDWRVHVDKDVAREDVNDAVGFVGQCRQYLALDRQRG